MKNHFFIAGWVIEIAGFAIWLYGYLEPGTASLVPWKVITPWWIADFLPNLQSELGMLLMCVGSAVVFWQQRRLHN